MNVSMLLRAIYFARKTITCSISAELQFLIIGRLSKLTAAIKTRIPLNTGSVKVKLG